jgi:uncharacterized spore protein YtfJ
VFASGIGVGPQDVGNLEQGSLGTGGGGGGGFSVENITNMTTTLVKG